MLFRFVGVAGIFVFLGMAYLLSSNRKRIDWRLVGIGIGIQFMLAIVVLASRRLTFDGQYPDGVLFFAMDWFFAQIGRFVEEGSLFLFGLRPMGENPPDRKSLIGTFAFGVLPTIIFFSALMSILYHLGIVQRVVGGLAWVMRRTLRISGAESLAVAANIFIGHTEAPLVVRPYLKEMTRSELAALMVGGFATITGSLLAVYAQMGISAGHLVAASFLSAPAALVMAKMLEPETGSPATGGQSVGGVAKETENVLEAATNGAGDGLKLALNIGAMLLAFVALIAMFDGMLQGTGKLVEYGCNSLGSNDVELNWSLAGTLGYLFAPFAFLIGVPPSECLEAGKLLGVKTIFNEFLAFEQLSQLEDGAVSERTRAVVTYALTGFSNLGAIAIQIGGIGSLAPERKKELARLGFRLMIGGSLACLMTASVAGVFI